MSLGEITLHVVTRISVNIMGMTQGLGLELGLGLAYFRDLCENNAHYN